MAARDCRIPAATWRGANPAREPVARRSGRLRRITRASGAASIGVIAGVVASAWLSAPRTGELERAARELGVAVRPRIDSISCAAGCGAHQRVMRGGTVELRGAGLRGIRKVVFASGEGQRDRVAAEVKSTSDAALSVTVPYRAVSGPLSAWAGRALASGRTWSLRVMPVPAPPQTGRLTRSTGPSDPGAPVLETAVSSGRAYVGGDGVRLTYRVAGGSAKVVVTVVDLSDGSILRRWNQGAIGPGVERTVKWDPRAATAPDDRYAFRVIATSPGGAAAHNAADDDQTRDAFDVHRWRFPIAAAHTYGQGFGVPRAGHRHQGQDILASCGTPIVAPRGGTVKVARYHAAAGNYVVLDGAGTGYDFLFAHLREPSPLRVGERVLTGEPLGNVGDTGDAVGCHLHFEIWTAPGWYTGGHPIDPAPELRAWDKYS